MLETLQPLVTGHGGNSTAKLEALSLVDSPHGARRHYAGQELSSAVLFSVDPTDRQNEHNDTTVQMHSGDDYPLLDWI